MLKEKQRPKLYGCDIILQSFYLQGTTRIIKSLNQPRWIGIPKIPGHSPGYKPTSLHDIFTKNYYQMLYQNIVLEYFIIQDHHGVRENPQQIKRPEISISGMVHPNLNPTSLLTVVWHGSQEPYQSYPQLGGRFISEFGMQALPSHRTISYFVTEKRELYPQSQTMDHHNKAAGFERRLGAFILENFRLQ